MTDVIKALGALKALGAAHLASMGDKDDKKLQAEQLAKLSGSSLRQAENVIAAGQAMAANPDIERAARSGRLSGEQLGVVSALNAEGPEAASQLVKGAQDKSLAELRQGAAALRAARGDAEARRRRAHEQRSLKSFTDDEGVWQLRASGPTEVGAMVMAAISALADKHFDQARQHGSYERPDAYSFDGLVDLAKGDGTAGPATEVIIRVGYDTLVRGYALEGEVCETVGFGPTTPQAIMELIDSADPVLRAVVTRGTDVVGVAHIGRKPNAAQRTALRDRLRWLYPTCAAAGCDSTASWLQTDHRDDWSKTHYTVLDLLDRLCPRHHRMKTYRGWRLVAGKGKRPFVPPGDPRHPGDAVQGGYGPGHANGTGRLVGADGARLEGGGAGRSQGAGPKGAGEAAHRARSARAVPVALQLDIDAPETGPAP